MWWLAFIGPVVVVGIYWLTARPETHPAVEIDRWRKLAANPRKVKSMPGPLARVLAATGGGEPVAYFELVQKLAYLTILQANAVQGSDHVTFVGKLDDGAPTFCVRPLPVLEGERVPNTGVEFKKDEELMDTFLVERTLDGEPTSVIDEAQDKAIRKWLSPVIREALLELPDGWLRVDGASRTMALTLYGPADAEKMDLLVETADIVFAEHGADGGPSLLPEDDDAPAAKAPPPKKPQPSKPAKGAKPA